MTASEPKTYIIGVGSDGLAGLMARARELITSADLILGSEHAPAYLAANTLGWGMA